MKSRLTAAFGLYLILATLAVFTLDGPFRAVVLLLAALAVKMCVHWKCENA